MQSVSDPNQEPEELPGTIQPSLRAVIYKLLDRNPDSRPDAAMLLTIPEIYQEVEITVNKIRQVDHEMAD